MAARWVRELFCDVVGVGMFGPAFICSISLFTLPGRDPSHCSDTHPQDTMRVQLCLRSLFDKRNGFAYPVDVDDWGTSMTGPWKSYAQENAGAPTSPTFSITFKAVAKLGAEIIGQAKKALGPSNIFNQKVFAYWVPDLVHRIVSGLPPNEVRRADSKFEVAGFPAMMNAAWYVYLFNLTALQLRMPGLEPAALKTRFYGLVSKGIDAAELQMRWQEAKDRDGNGSY